MSSETFMAHVVTDPDGTVVACTPFGINGRREQGAPIPDAQGQADYVAGWAAQPGQTAHVWIGGDPVDVPVGGRLDGVRHADASAVKA